MVGDYLVRAQTGRERITMGTDSAVDATTVFMQMRQYRWTDTSTNITSLELNSSVASNIGIGSWASLYQLVI